MKKKVLVFGTGLFYKNRKDHLIGISYNKAEIVGFLDNNAENICECDGKPVFHPNDIKTLEFDLVVLMSKSLDEMKEQLIKMGIGKQKIIDWDTYRREMSRGVFRFYCGLNEVLPKKNILVLSDYLDYNGGAMVAVYAVKVLYQKGYNVILAAQDGNENYVQEIADSGINVMICSDIHYFKAEEQFLIRQFDVVLVNTFPMLPCAVRISKIKPVLWWMHEPSYFYPIFVSRFKQYIDKDAFKNINIKAVSRIAQNNFNNYCSNEINSILSFGIPDNLGKIESKQNSKIVFALIGYVENNKAQEVFLNAIVGLSEQEKRNTEFWLIGAVGNKEYFEKIENIAERETSVYIKGLMSQEDIVKAYEEIDVMVCPSYEDTFSVVITEGMMYAKPCIVSDTTGVAEYVHDGENGFVIKAGDVIALSEKLKYFIHNRESITRMGMKARETYEKYFTMDRFGEVLESSLLETINEYEAKNR